MDSVKRAEACLRQNRDTAWDLTQQDHVIAQFDSVPKKENLRQRYTRLPTVCPPQLSSVPPCRYTNPTFFFFSGYTPIVHSPVAGSIEAAVSLAYVAPSLTVITVSCHSRRCRRPYLPHKLVAPAPTRRFLPPKCHHCLLPSHCFTN